MKYANKLIENKQDDNVKLAAYLLDVALRINPDDKDAIFAFESNSLHDKVDWKPIFKEPLEKPDVTTVRQEPVQVQPPTPVPHTGPPPRPQRVVITKESAAEYYKAHHKKYEQRQARVKGLFVTFTENGMQGMVMDIIASVTETADLRRFGCGFAPGRQIGEQMKKAHVEAYNLVRGRYPFWPGGTQVSYSFRDKYTPKDGGSAGTAFSLLLLSLLDGVKLNSEYAVTGDISVDWKILRVGGVVAKIGGARDAKLKGVVIPVTNERAVYDLILLESLAEVWKIHVFTIDNLTSAIETMRVDQTEERMRGLELFAKVQKYLLKKGRSGLSKSVYGALLKVEKDLPNSLSTRILIEAYKGKLRHRTLSLSSGVSQLIRCNAMVLPLLAKPQPKTTAVSPYTQMPVRRQTPPSIDEKLKNVTKEGIQKARDEMKKLERVLPRDVKNLHMCFSELLRNVETYTRFRRSSRSSSRAFVDLKLNVLPKRVTAIREELDRLSKDDEFIKRFTSGL